MLSILNISARIRISINILILSVLSSASFADVGDKAADFSLPNLLTRETVSLSDYIGAVILVDFWASWCGPCRASFPAYEKLRNRLQEKYGEENFEVLAINVDMEKSEAFSFLKSRAVTFPILDENTGGDTQHKYQILAMPTAFLIDQSGIIVFQHSGFNSSYASHIERIASELIESKTLQH